MIPYVKTVKKKNKTKQNKTKQKQKQNKNKMVKFNFDHKNPRNIHFSLGLWQKVSYNE